MKHLRQFVLLVLVISMISAFWSTWALTADKSTNSTATGNYSDIAGTWSEKWVNLYGYSEIFSSSDGSFHPDQAMTRIEFARLLHKALKININYFAATDISEYYNDVKSGDIGCNELYDLVTCGIIDTKKSYRPNEAIKRDEMVHYIMNAFHYAIGNEYAFIEIYHIFKDDSDIKPEHITDIQHSFILGLTTGRNDNRIFPNDTATRAEAVTITGRLVELEKKLDTSVNVKASAVETSDGLKMELVIANSTDKTVTISHSSQQMFDFAIFDNKGNSIYRWSANRMFAQMISTSKIAPGEDLVLSDTLSSKEYFEIKAKAATMKAYIVGTSSDFTINPDGYFVTDIA
ncbi:MAG: S-layer homology domain-containing protein [Oscillospiraceae bacterium]|nr:S-layer homology domain-containing protein [Oscillospiraceae bacterium]